MNRKYLFLLTFFISCETLAAEGLGRLFLTPEQRSQLDISRAKRDQRLPITTETDPAATAPVPQGPEIVTYNGVVRRSDGKSTVWLNGKAVNERNRIGNDGDSKINVLGMRSDGALSVAIPQADRTASLKVGQSLDVMSGRIEESYARHATRQRPPENAPASVPARPPSAPQAAVSGTTSSPTRTRPLPESYFKESDPGSGAAPPVDRGLQK